MRHKLVLWFLILVAGFLVGFIVQYSQLRQVQQERKRPVVTVWTSP
jgi:hypothetical protein